LFEINRLIEVYFWRLIGKNFYSALVYIFIVFMFLFYFWQLQCWWFELIVMRSSLLCVCRLLQGMSRRCLKWNFVVVLQLTSTWSKVSIANAYVLVIIGLTLWSCVTGLCCVCIRWQSPPTVLKFCWWLYIWLSLLTLLTDTPLLNTMHNSSRRDKGQLKARNLKTVLYTTHGK